jgi:hypothetical protein
MNNHTFSATASIRMSRVVGTRADQGGFRPDALLFGGQGSAVITTETQEALRKATPGTVTVFAKPVLDDGDWGG